MDYLPSQREIIEGSDYVEKLLAGIKELTGVDASILDENHKGKTRTSTNRPLGVFEDVMGTLNVDLDEACRIHHQLCPMTLGAEIMHWLGINPHDNVKTKAIQIKSKVGIPDHFYPLVLLVCWEFAGIKYANVLSCCGNGIHNPGSIMYPTNLGAPHKYIAAENASLVNLDNNFVRQIVAKIHNPTMWSSGLRHKGEKKVQLKLSSGEEKTINYSLVPINNRGGHCGSFINDIIRRSDDRSIMCKNVANGAVVEVR